MPGIVLPSAKWLVVDFLAEHPLLIPFHAGRVGTTSPGVYPFARVSRVGGVPDDWEDQPLVQVECWAVKESQADAFGRATVAAFADVVGVHRLGSIRGYEVLSLLEDQDEKTKNYRSLVTVRLLSYANT